MAIVQDEIKEMATGGFKKRINAGAMLQVMENVQISQYQYPQRSTIRELVSNALDSVREKWIAHKIIREKEPVEKYYVQRDDQYRKDSNFNPEYYDFNYLWMVGNWKSTTLEYEPDNVYITYYDTGTDKNRIEIRDFGVGLGGKRLQGYFDPGYSTKRNTNFALGKFGIGAKSPLSTGVSFYTTISVYNGMEFRFNVYSNDAYSTVPKLNTVTGEVNPHVIFEVEEEEHIVDEEGTVITKTRIVEKIVHYIPTKAPNGVTIMLEVKKHHKQLYIDAVKSQLLYFPNIVFNVVTETGTQFIPTLATIIYEDDVMVLSDNNQYSKPHILINKVNYG